MSHDWQYSVFQSVECREVEQEAEDALPDILLGCLEGLSYYFIDLLIEIKLHAIIVNKLSDFLMDLTSLVLTKVHQRIPIGTEAICCEGSLHLLRVQEVKVGAVEDPLQSLDIVATSGASLVNLICIFVFILLSITYYELLGIR